MQAIRYSGKAGQHGFCTQPACLSHTAAKHLSNCLLTGWEILLLSDFPILGGRWSRWCSCILPGWVGVLHRAQRTPDGTVALEAGTESNLPHTVAPTYPVHAFNVAQHVPAECTRFRMMARWVSIPCQGMLRSETIHGLACIVVLTNFENLWCFL